MSAGNAYIITFSAKPLTRKNVCIWLFEKKNEKKEENFLMLHTTWNKNQRNTTKCHPFFEPRDLFIAFYFHFIKYFSLILHYLYPEDSLTHLTHSCQSLSLRTITRSFVCPGEAGGTSREAERRVGTRGPSVHSKDSSHILVCRVKI